MLSTKTSSMSRIRRELLSRLSRPGAGKGAAQRSSQRRLAQSPQALHLGTSSTPIIEAPDLIKPLVLGMPLSRAAFEHCLEIAKCRAREALPIREALLECEQTVSQLWSRVLEGLAAIGLERAMESHAIFVIGRDLARLTSQLTSAVADAYCESVIRFPTGANSQRAELVAGLLSGGLEGQNLKDCAEAQFLIAPAFEVLIVREGSKPTRTPSLIDYVRSNLGACLADSLTDSNMLIVCRYLGELIAIVPLPHTTYAREFERKLDALLGGAEHVTAIVFAGSAEEGLEGISESYRNAVRALSAVGPNTRNVFGFIDALPRILLRESPGAADDLLRWIVDPLEVHDSVHQSQLVRSVEGYLASGCNLAAAARSLFVHRHTLMNHLERVEQLTGLSLLSQSDLLALRLALIAREAFRSGHGERVQVK
jgi:hypothetical protein